MRDLRIFKCIVLFLVTVLLSGCFGQTKQSTTYTGMGTVISVSVYGKGQETVKKITDEFIKIENASSLTREGSAINILNETGTSTDICLIEQISISMDVFQKSNGAYDHTVGALTSLWNIGFENASVPENSQIQDALTRVDGGKTEIKDGRIRLQEGVITDLGGITKGYALDKAREILIKEKASAAVITVGGSVLFYGENPNGKAWTCAVRDPFNETGYLGTFKTGACAVSTSGTYERFFEEDGRIYHHILDPKTGYPKENELVSVTVISESGALSDALSTACFVLGKDEGERLLSEYNAKGIFVEKNGNVSVWGDIVFERY